MNSELITTIFSYFMPFAVEFAVALYLCEFIFRFIMRLAFGRVNSSDKVI